MKRDIFFYLAIVGLLVLFGALGVWILRWQTKPSSPAIYPTPSGEETIHSPSISPTPETTAGEGGVSGGERAGTVAEIQGTRLTLDLDGELKTFDLGGEHMAVREVSQPAEDQPPIKFIEISDIKVGNKVVAYLNEQGEVQTIMIKE